MVVGLDKVTSMCDDGLSFPLMSYGSLSFQHHETTSKSAQHMWRGDDGGGLDDEQIDTRSTEQCGTENLLLL